MAKLKRCKDCGSEVSKKAEKCPQCGAPLKRKPLGCGALILILMVIGIWVSVYDNNFGSKSPAGKAAIEAQSIPSSLEGKKALETRLLAELKTIPVKEFDKNLERYKKLIRMFPDNVKYQQKVKYYSDKVDRRKLIERQFSSWNGSHKTLEDYIRKNLKNPDSYDHVETLYVDKGDHILLETTYRATNSFNAIVTEKVYAKSTLDGSQVTILAQ